MNRPPATPLPLAAVMTTIQPPTPAARAVARAVAAVGGELIVAGDRKGPGAFPCEGAHFLSLDDQLHTPFTLARRLPTGHYARKNVAYLTAMARGAACIYETDDDNTPCSGWAPRTERVCGLRSVAAPGGGTGRWVNVYRYFTSAEDIWPRGLPLDACRTPAPAPAAAADEVWAPIQQGLVDGSPDVDAIWRLVLDRPFRFDAAPGVRLAPGNWCPFNTQSTWWWPVAYPLMYIPSRCTFRMCDIWRSFVAQRCLWELGAGLVFHAAEVDQDRNAHDLMRDFADEVPGYRYNRAIAATLERLTLAPDAGAVADNLLRCYMALVEASFLPADELDLVNAWLADLEALAP